MGDTDPVTWGELKEYCTDRRDECGKLRSAENETAFNVLSAKLDALRQQVETLSSRTGFFLQRPILYFLMAGCVGVGFAGREAAKLLATWLGIAK